ncbi:MAG TPA: hypothetical protein VGD04_11400 [Methylophilus sp.]
MKLPYLLASGLLLLPQLTMAACNTVMGGCVKEASVNVAPHMRTEVVKPVQKPAATPHKDLPQIVTTVHKAKAASKKL